MRGLARFLRSNTIALLALFVALGGTTYEHGGKQYIAILSGVGGWAGIGLAAGLTKPTDGLGAVGGYAALKNYTSLGGQLTVFALP